MKKIITISVLMCLFIMSCSYFITEKYEEPVIEKDSKPIEELITEKEPEPIVKEIIEEKFVEKCEFPSGLYCKEILGATSSSIEFVMKNDKGLPIVINSISGSKTCTSIKIAPSVTLNYQTFNQQTIKTGGAFKVMLAGCNNGNSEEIVNETIKIIYTNKMTEVEYETEGNIFFLN